MAPNASELVERSVGLVPIRISVVVTLRELQPVSSKRGMQQVRGPKMGLRV